ncbi:MAG: YqhA family protein [Anaerolineales bacterium]|jgi:uncharacterized membrane protein YqhA
MQRFVNGTRYLIIIPILGLAIAASIIFIFGGIGLLRMLVELLIDIVAELTGQPTEIDRSLVVIEMVDFIHTFLVGTVLYITAIGFYQLFIKEINLPGWLKIDSTEELESNLIGVTVVVLAVYFMSGVLLGGIENLLEYGAGIGLIIAALGLFIGLRAWSTKLDKEIAASEEGWSADAAVDHPLSEDGESK